MGDVVVTGAWRQQIDAWDMWLTAARRPATTRGLRTYHVRRLARGNRQRDPLQLGHDDLVTWMAEHQWAAATLRSVRASLRGSSGWAARTGHLDVDPSVALPSVSAPRRTPRTR